MQESNKPQELDRRPVKYMNPYIEIIRKRAAAQIAGELGGYKL